VSSWKTKVASSLHHKSVPQEKRLCNFLFRNIGERPKTTVHDLSFSHVRKQPSICTETDSTRTRLARTRTRHVSPRLTMSGNPGAYKVMIMARCGVCAKTVVANAVVEETLHYRLYTRAASIDERQWLKPRHLPSLHFSR
jgi:hypothetical protein